MKEYVILLSIIRKSYCALISLIVVFAFPTIAYAGEFEDMQNALDESKAQLQSAALTEKTATVNLEDAEKHIAELYAKINTINNKIAKCQNMLNNDVISYNVGLYSLVINNTSMAKKFGNTDYDLTSLENMKNNFTTELSTYEDKVELLKEDVATAQEQQAAAQEVINRYSERVERVQRAYDAIGTPYVWGATGPNCYDCSGLVGYCLTGSYNRIGTTYTFMGWSRAENPQPGDIVTNDHHCGLYIGDGLMIHAPQSGETVKISEVHAGMRYVQY